MTNNLWSNIKAKCSCDEKTIQTILTPIADVGGWVSLGSTVAGVVLNNIGDSSYTSVSSAIATGIGGLIYVVFSNLVAGTKFNRKCNNLLKTVGNSPEKETREKFLKENEITIRAYKIGGIACRVIFSFFIILCIFAMGLGFISPDRKLSVSIPQILTSLFVLFSTALLKLGDKCTVKKMTNKLNKAIQEDSRQDHQCYEKIAKNLLSSQIVRIISENKKNFGVFQDKGFDVKLVDDDNNLVFEKMLKNNNFIKLIENDKIIPEYAIKFLKDHHVDAIEKNSNVYKLLNKETLNITDILTWDNQLTDKINKNDLIKNSTDDKNAVLNEIKRITNDNIPDEVTDIKQEDKKAINNYNKEDKNTDENRLESTNNNNTNKTI